VESAAHCRNPAGGRPCRSRKSPKAAPVCVWRHSAALGAHGSSSVEDDSNRSWSCAAPDPAPTAPVVRADKNVADVAVEVPIDHGGLGVVMESVILRCPFGDWRVGFVGELAAIV
jgi:hypothetical protein